MEAALVESLKRKFWHRVPLGPHVPDEELELLAFIFMKVGDDLSTFTQFGYFPDTSMTAERLVRRAQRRSVLNPAHCYHFDWAIESLGGEIVAMPSEDQIQVAALAVAMRRIAGQPLPLMVLAHLRSFKTGAYYMEFWHPEPAPTQPLWDFFLLQVTMDYL